MKNAKKLYKRVRKATAGKKTYTLVVLGLVYAIAGYSSGNIDADTAMTAVYAALGLGGIRDAIK